MNKILSYLGLARRSSSLITGTDAVIESLSKIKIVFVARDASSATIDKFEKKCYFYHVPLILDYTSVELSQSTGLNVKVLGITNEGIAGKIKELTNKGGSSHGN